jgi:hypothetical protein
MKRMFVLLLFSVAVGVHAQQAKPLWKGRLFTVYADSVVQNGFVGKAVSSAELLTNYKSPANEFLSPGLTFKFSINGKDNEMKSGVDHRFNCVSEGKGCEVPLIQFGKQFVDNRPLKDNTYLKPQTPFKVRLDMREVMKAFKSQGFYTTFKGDKIYKQDFKGVFIAGNTAPMTWDFDNLHNRNELKLKDDDGDGIFETTLVLNNPSDEKTTASSWKLSRDVSAFPQYKSPYPISDAVYNMALEEMIRAVEPDSTFRTGKEWAGVWTRDISYSIILSMAHLQPQVAKYSLLRKVSKRKRIIQDTGTGGAWPCSTDRMIWATAAWELYKATGDEDWLKQAYEIISASLEDDYKVAYDKETGLVKGESSFLDWREQTYPKWMQPVDIYESEALGTNAVHFNANLVAANMAKLLGRRQDVQRYQQAAQRIKDGMNKMLWQPSKGYYGQYLYGRSTKILSPRAETLGEALSVLFGIADGGKAAQIISRTPVMDYGVPCIYPQIPNLPPYHNNAVWPFVQSYYAMAAAKAGNEAAVLESIAAVYRPAALWVTNKENFVATNGDFAGTVINSSNMLWSLSGSLALVHKILFGIRFEAEGLHFQPFVPSALKGSRSLTNFRYREAVLDIQLEGYGNTIKSFLHDGKASTPFVPKNLKGKHTIRITLSNQLPQSRINLVEPSTTLNTPLLSSDGNQLNWEAVSGATKYLVLKNGKELAQTTNTFYPLTGKSFAEYQVIALDANNVSSFASEPVMAAYGNIYEMEKTAGRSTLPYNGFSGEGFVEVSKTRNTVLSIPVFVPETGVYAIDFRYANGNGPINTENKCAIRSLYRGNAFLGAVILPQRGTGEWSNWGWSNPIQTTLQKGQNVLALRFEPADENMNEEINQAMLDFVRVVRVK